MIRISIIGTRGIPAKYGGFETFTEKISELLVNNGFKVSIQCDAGSYDGKEYNGADLFFSKVLKSDNPVRYYYEGLKWAFRNSDIVIVATTFGSWFYFLKYFYKKPVITITDGIEYKRGKWPLPHRIYIRISEFLAGLFSDYLVADSEMIRQLLISKYPFISRKTETIEYGADIVNSVNEDILYEYGLKPYNYYITVCRLEPENNLMMIIEGYKLSKTEIPIIIVGSLKENKYGRKLKLASDSPKIRFLGGIYDKDKLKSLRFACRAYIHGHSVGGTNPSLLEAMGCGNLVICHDNVFNREVAGIKQFYFLNPDDLADVIRKTEGLSAEEKKICKEDSTDRIINYYNWDRILKKYLDLLNNLPII